VGRWSGLFAKLKLYRASLLKAAVEGDLTREWREQHPDAEPASELLKRILVERRKRMEADQLAKFKEKGKEPPAVGSRSTKIPSSRYRQPARTAQGVVLGDGGTNSS
jgi:hypothetical protein